MPNDLTTKRNLLDAREDLRLESRRKLASSGFTASTWTLSGVVLVACGGAGKITDALCPNFDAAVLVSCGGGSPPSGERHYVRSSDVQGARLYFDMNNDKVINDMDIATQNGQYPEGFVTDANGERAPIPLHLYGKPFVAILDGAINADIDESFPAGIEYYSITHPMPAPDEGDQDSLLLPFHNLASPITDWIAFQAGFKPSQQQPQPPVRTSSQVFDAVNDVIANLLWSERYSLLNEEQQAIVDLLYAEILNPANYEGNPAIEALSAYLATNPTLENVQSEAQSLIEEVRALVNSDSANALIVLHVDDEMSSANDVTIGTNGAYVATVYAVSTGGVRYRMVDENGAEFSGGDFVVDSRTGVISVADGAALTASNTPIPVYVQVTSGGESETVKIDVTVEPVITLSSGSTNDVAENDVGAVAVMGIEAGDTATAEDFIISVLGGLSGYADKFEMEAVPGATNMWNLKLKSGEAGESLDYEAIRGGEIKINVQVEPDNHAPSNVLEFTITVTDDPMDITFSGDFGGEVIEDATDEDNLEGSVSGTITVRNNRDSAPVTVDQSEPDADGKYGTLTLNEAGDGWTYTLGVDATGNPLTDDVLAEIQSLRADEFLVDTATISVGTASKDIYVIIHGKNEDVGFGGDHMRIEIGDTTALDGSFALGFGLTELLGGDEPTIEFADSVPVNLHTLFDLNASGNLIFTGDNADALALGVSTIELAMIASAPQSTTEDIPFTVQVNVANDMDNGDASYEITENQAGTELSVALVDADPNSATYSEDPDGVVGTPRYQWFKIEENGDRTNVGADPTSATYTIASGDEDLNHGVYIGYTDGAGTLYTHTDGNDDTTIEVFVNSVYFTEDDQTINRNEGTIPTTMLARVSASSLLTPPQTVSYAIGTDGDSALFTVNSNGEISLLSAGTWDFESNKKEYVVEVIASADDGIGRTDTASAQITFAVQDVNEHDPVIAGGATATAPISEDATAGTVLTTVTATDDDTADTLRYTITSGDGTNLFAIADASSGEITLTSAGANMLDHETTTSYTLVVTVTDDGTPNPRTSTPQTVTVTVTGVNDNAPDIVVADSTPSVTEQTASADTDIITDITVTDNDRGKTYAQGDFALIGDSKFKFVWDATDQTGSVVLTSGSTIAAGTISLSLTVTDANPVGHTGTDTQTLTITVAAMEVQAESPPYIPTRQEQAHQDSYDPDDLGLTPIPDADPQAG